MGDLGNGGSCFFREKERSFLKEEVLAGESLFIDEDLFGLDGSFLIRVLTDEDSRECSECETGGGFPANNNIMTRNFSPTKPYQPRLQVKACS